MTRSDPVAKGGENVMSVSCERCGAVAGEPPLTWVTSLERDHTVYYCDTCARDNVRSIEAGLDAAYW